MELCRERVRMLSSHRYQLTVQELGHGNRAALALSSPTSRFERMAKELDYAMRRTSKEDMAALLGHLARDGGSALVRRVKGLWSLGEKILSGSADELQGMLKAYSADHLVGHIKKRAGAVSAITSATVSRGATSFSSLVRDLIANPTQAGPKLLVLVLSSVVVSGGVDGNGGVPDLDIPLMGIGEHRSPFTHSIIIGSLLEAGLLMLTRIVLGTHKNLPTEHDPLWDSVAQQSALLLTAAGQGASIGIAYHLMIDAVVQPGAYHGLPFDMPLEAHQAILAANSVSEATAAKSYPDEETVNITPEIRAAHKRHRMHVMEVSEVLKAWMTLGEIAVLSEYGMWLQALVKRDIQPTSLAQVRFLKTSRGQLAPVTIYEKAWASFMEAKVLAGWIAKP